MGKNPPGIHKVGDTSLVLPETYMGLEFEVENYNANVALPQDVANFWSIKDDHSLRNKGIEFVFNEPLFGKDITSAIDNFIKWQRTSKIKTSVRTGLHAHLDVRELDAETLRSFLMLYAALEPLLYSWVGSNREESNFCVPWYYSDVAIKTASDIISGLNLDEQELVKQGVHGGHGKHASERYERYAGLNLQSLMRFGSVEFRHMPMTFDHARILEWVNLVMSFKKAAREYAPAQISQLLKDTKYNINQVACVVSPLFKKCFSNYSVKSETKINACSGAESFLDAGKLRPWKRGGAKYAGQNPVLAGQPPARQVPEPVPQLAEQAPIVVDAARGYFIEVQQNNAGIVDGWARWAEPPGAQERGLAAAARDPLEQRNDRVNIRLDRPVGRDDVEAELALLRAAEAQREARNRYMEIGRPAVARANPAPNRGPIARRNRRNNNGELG